MDNNKTIAIITAGGVGSRTGQDIPKQFLHINNKPLLIYTLEAFQKHPSVDAIIVSCLDGWQDVLDAYSKQFNITKLAAIVDGGKTGQDSIRNGLEKAKESFDEDSVIIIHDGNRGMVSSDIISNALSVYRKNGSAVAAIPCTEAVFYSDDGITSEKDIPRDRLYRTQTPHVYSLKKLLWAHNEAEKRGITNTTASCTLMTQLGETTYLSKGSEKNIKITTTDDIEIFKALLSAENDDWIK